MNNYLKIFSNNFHVIKETQNFVVIPSEGAMVSGWLLIIPKKGALRFSELMSENDIELEELIKYLSDKIKKKYSIMPTIFEHGPQCLKQTIGCSVDYAHLHLVPLNFSLIDEVEKFDNVIKFEQISKMSNIKNYLDDYIFIKEPKKKIHISTTFTKTSQYLRKIIAFKLSITDKYNWKLFPFQENINKTIECFR